MNIALWIVAVVLGVASLGGGAMKLFQPKEKLLDSGWAWVDDFSGSTVQTIGVLEMLAGVGLILPAAVDIAPVMVPVAATGLAVLMAAAAFTHFRRQESKEIVVTVVLLAVSAFVAWGRFGPESF